jgi:hypothetical protein
LQVVAVLPVERAGRAAAVLLGVAREVFEVAAAGDLDVVAEVERGRAAAAGEGDGLLQARAVGAVDDAGDVAAVDRLGQPVLAVVLARVAPVQAGPLPPWQVMLPLAS